jgi:hypothetical protein
VGRKRKKKERQVGEGIVGNKVFFLGMKFCQKIWLEKYDFNFSKGFSMAKMAQIHHISKEKILNC